jgi:hypothetical protein
MTAYLILGAGKFGSLALERLALGDAAARFVAVDLAPGALAAARAAHPGRVQGVASEAIAFLVEHLKEDSPWDWLLPMVPVHVAGAWLKAGPLARLPWEPLGVPEAVAALVPVTHRGKAGELFLSRARHRCPDDCLEPEGGCPVSGELWETPLYGELAALKVPGFQVRVIPSRQLAPGVGGYPPRRLLALGREVGALKGKVLIATACRCHGVVEALNLGPGRDG